MKKLFFILLVGTFGFFSTARSATLVLESYKTSSYEIEWFGNSTGIFKWEMVFTSTGGSVYLREGFKMDGDTVYGSSNILGSSSITMGASLSEVFDFNMVPQPYNLAGFYDFVDHNGIPYQGGVWRIREGESRLVIMAVKARATDDAFVSLSLDSIEYSSSRTNWSDTQSLDLNLDTPGVFLERSHTPEPSVSLLFFSALFLGLRRRR